MSSSTPWSVTPPIPPPSSYMSYVCIPYVCILTPSLECVKIGLRARYGVSGTYLGYAATRPQDVQVSRYAPRYSTMRHCAVLRCGLLSAEYKGGTELGHAVWYVWTAHVVGHLRNAVHDVLCEEWCVCNAEAGTEGVCVCGSWY
eukprot:2925388-Rhodomonas_salina.1